MSGHPSGEAEGNKLSRRNFLKAGGATLAGGLAAAGTPAAIAGDPPRQDPQIQTYKTLGRTGWRVSDIAFGTGPLREPALVRAAAPLTSRWRALKLLEGDARKPGGKPAALAMLMLDLDHFKMINDRFGHSTGDEALRYFTKLAKGVLRDRDHFARLGGEEFAALLPGTPLDAAVAVAERIRAMTADAGFEDEQGIDVPLSVSIGVTELPADDPRPLAVLNRADKALYLTKKSGRNRVAKATIDRPPELV